MEDRERLANYTSHVAHDLNNVFSVVIGSLGIVLEEYADRPLDDEAMTLVEDAVSAGREGARLIESLLGCVGRQALRREPVPVAEVAREVGALVSRTAAASVHVEVSSEPHLPPAWTDRSRLRQSLLALALNGCEAMADGGKLSIVAGTAVAADGASNVSVRVTDTGAGMAPEVLEQAREPFFTTHSPRRGRGLGLSVADGFARQCGGSLAISSTPGRGTTVALELPRQPAHVPPGSSPRTL